MTAPSLIIPGRLDFGGMIRDFILQTEKFAQLCDSPRRVEFKVCAFLAAWESVACHDSNASHWFELWQECCRKHHRGKAGRTLADSDSPPARRLQVSPEERAKAFSKVRTGLRQVFKRTLNHYFPGDEGHTSLRTGSDAAILYQMIQASFRAAKSFACPEGLEVFLRTLIELFEQSLGTEGDHLVSHEAWLSEIHRSRSGGPPETRTLADVAPAEVRLARQKAFPEKERMEILRRMLPALRQLARELQAYLDKRAPATRRPARGLA